MASWALHSWTSFGPKRSSPSPSFAAFQKLQDFKQSLWPSMIDWKLNQTYIKASCPFTNRCESFWVRSTGLARRQYQYL